MAIWYFNVSCICRCWHSCYLYYCKKRNYAKAIRIYETKGSSLKKSQEKNNPTKVELSLSLEEHINSIDEHINFKEQDRKHILEYLKGKAEVHVDDIMENSGAERLRVYPIIFEEVMAGYVVVVKESDTGAPVIVSLREE